MINVLEIETRLAFMEILYSINAFLFGERGNMEQQSLFEYLREPFAIRKPIRLTEIFAGYGSQAMAMERLGANFEHYRAIEFDKYAMASYNACHDTDFVPTDVCDVRGGDMGIVDTDKYCYIWTYSFP